MKGVGIIRRDLQSHKHSSVVGALISIVEQADVPVGMHRREKAHQRAWPLGEHETEEPFVVGQLAAAAHHVTHMLLGEIVVCEVDGREALALELGGDSSGLVTIGC